MTTLGVYRRFQKLYQEKSSRHFDYATAGSWAVEAMNDSIDALDAEIAEVHPEFMGSLSRNTSYTANAQEVTLDAGVVEIIAVEVNDRGGPPYPRLRPADFRDRSKYRLPESADWLGGGGSGEPSHYYVRGDDPASAASKLGWIPIPARTAANNVTYWFHGTRIVVSVIDDATTPDIPVLWHPLLAWHMAVIAAGSDERSVLNYFTGMYNSRLQLRLAAAIRGQAEYQYEVVEVVDE